MSVLRHNFIDQFLDLGSRARKGISAVTRSNKPPSAHQCIFYHCDLSRESTPLYLILVSQGSIVLRYWGVSLHGKHMFGLALYRNPGTNPAAPVIPNTVVRSLSKITDTG